MKRPAYREPKHDIKPGHIVDWPADAPAPADVASCVKYAGNAEHKTYLSQAGPPAYKWDKSKCDRFEPETWPLLEQALRDAIKAGCIARFNGDFPSRAWAYVNGVLHEARLHNFMLGECHAFPINDTIQFPTPIDRLQNAPHVTIATQI